MLPSRVPLPSPDAAQVVVPAPAPGPGNWSGAPAAVLVDGVVWLAYRTRRRDGRGVATHVARSSDGVHFEPVAEIGRQALGAESFERPALVPLPDGGWRLYLSCATPGSKHWWVEALDAPSPAELPRGRRIVVLPGSADVGVKDPVVLRHAGTWHLWLCCHPLDVAGAEDRMTTRYLTSTDGLRWDDHGVALAPSGDGWDARGTRVTAVVTTEPLAVLYDGRPDAAANWFERTGLASADRLGDVRLRPAGDAPVAASPHSDGALRYATSIALADGSVRFYFEAARPDGAHDLMTSLWHHDGRAAHDAGRAANHAG